MGRHVRSALRGWSAARQVFRDAADQHAELRDTARRAYREAEWARSRHRMVRQAVFDAPTPKAARSATYRIVHDAAKAAAPRPVFAPVRAIHAGGRAAGAWVVAGGYAAWARHWETQQRLALGAAAAHRGYVVADRIRATVPTVVTVEVAVPAPRPSVVRPPRWRPTTGAVSAPVDGATTPSGSSILTTTGGLTVSRFHISDLAVEQAARAARYAPESMAYFGGDLQQWPESIGHLALALSTFVKKGSAEYPVHPVVMEKLAEVYRALGTAAAAANEVPALFSRAHSIDLSRHQAPRPGEHLWNVSR